MFCRDTCNEGESYDTTIMLRVDEREECKSYNMTTKNRKTTVDNKVTITNKDTSSQRNRVKEEKLDITRTVSKIRHDNLFGNNKPKVTRHA